MRQRRGRHPLRALVVLVAVLASSSAAAAATGPARISVRVGRPLLAVPPSFLGVSVELNELLRYDRYRASFVRLLDVLRPPGDGSPLTLRIGGESADSSFWGPDPFALVKPAYRQSHPYVLTPAWMTEAGSLVRAGAMKVIFDLNLAAHSPAMAAAVATAAWNAFPPQSISFFEIGNEPDLYRFGLVGLTQAVRGRWNTWAFDFGIHDYMSLFDAYTRALSVLPGARFAGPAGDNRETAWLTALAPRRKVLSLVTEHYYPPFAGCVAEGTRKYPTASAYLQDAVAAGFAQGERPMVDAAHALGRPVRLTETGSSVCGGVRGQTDTFATALWGVDALFNLLSVRLDGVNIHLRGNAFPNTALLLTQSGIYAEPLFYGLALFARALGPGAELMRAVQTGAPTGMKVWVVRLGDGSLRAMYINKTAQNASVSFAAGSAATAVVDRITASSIAANQSVAFDGQRLAADGWTRPPVGRRVHPRAGSYELTVPAFSAALLSVPGHG